MSRKSKSKDQTKALNIPLTLTQGDLLQEALAVTFVKDQTKALNIPLTLTQGDLLQEALAVTFAKDQTQALNIPVKVPLGGGRYAELTEWNGSKRVDLRFWKTDTIPTKVGVSLSLPQWKVLYSAMQVVDDLISWVKDGEMVGESDFKAPNLPLSLRLKWKELIKTIPLFEDRGPALRTMDNKVTGEY